MNGGFEIKDKTTRTEGIKIAPFRKGIRKTSPHKHNNYFEIIYLTKGSGTHTIDSKEYGIKPPIIFTVRKEQVHFWDIRTEPEGFVLIIKKAFITDCLDRDIKPLISRLSQQNCLYPKDGSAIAFFDLLWKEHDSSERPLMEGLLKALLAKLLESRSQGNPKNENSGIFQRFLDLLGQEDKLINNVGFYADQLATSPQNLNTICRKETGQSATGILSEHIISEAKRLLLYTDATVSEVSTMLQFKDNSHFSKYFKRHAGNTPLGFRKAHH